MKHITEYSKFNESWVGDKFHSLIDAISLKLNNRYENRIKQRIDSYTPEERTRLLKIMTRRLANYSKPAGITQKLFNLSKHSKDHFDAIICGSFGIHDYMTHDVTLLTYFMIFICLLKYKDTIKSYNDNEEDTYKEIIDYIKSSLKDDTISE